jgi:hypothetical protein
MISNMENESGYGFPLAMLWLIGFTGFMLEGSRIVAEPKSSDGLAFIGPLFADVFRAAGAGHRDALRDLEHPPRDRARVPLLDDLDKLRHMFIGPVNIFFKPLDQGSRPAIAPRRSATSRTPRPSASSASRSTPGSSSSTWRPASSAAAARSTARR